jgi:hypothetical protein
VCQKGAIYHYKSIKEKEKSQFFIFPQEAGYKGGRG